MLLVLLLGAHRWQPRKEASHGSLSSRALLLLLPAELLRLLGNNVRTGTEVRPPSHRALSRSLTTFTRLTKGRPSALASSSESEDEASTSVELKPPLELSLIHI